MHDKIIAAWKRRSAELDRLQREPVDTLAQCWWCGEIQRRLTPEPERVKCWGCRGPLELLTVDGVPQ